MRRALLILVAFSFGVLGGCQKKPVENKVDALLRAARNNDVNGVREALNRGVDVNVLNSQRESALMLAARNGHLETARFLVSKGADVRLRNESDLDALIYAAVNDFPEVVAFLHQAGVDQSRIDLSYVLMHGSSARAEQLIDLGCDPNYQGILRVPPILLSVNSSNPNLFPKLLESGADLQARSADGSSLLHVAITGKKDNWVELLLNAGSDVNMADRDGVVPLHLAAKARNLPLMQQIIDRGADINAKDKNHATAAFIAALIRDTEMMTLLIKNHADLSIKSIWGTPLEYSEREKDAAMLSIIQNQFQMKPMIAEMEVVPQGDDNFKVAQFRMWVPEGISQLRGTLVVTLGFNHDGRVMVEDTAWRDVAIRQKMALMTSYWVSVLPPGGTKTAPHRHYGHVLGGSGTAFWKALNGLSDQLKHPELKQRPIALWGHSAGGQWSYSMACTYPDRVAGFVSIKGGYYHTKPVAGLIAHVPGLLIAGGKDEVFRLEAIRRVFEDGRTVNAPWMRVVEPDAGHGVEKSNDLAIPYLEGVLALRVDDKGLLKKIRQGDGWVGDLKTHKIFPAQGWKGSKTMSVWCPMREIAQRWQSFWDGSGVGAGMENGKK